MRNFMELGKTAKLSIFVWVAGILSEAMFHDVLSGSRFGIVLSVAIALVVIVSTYFVIDGVSGAFCEWERNLEQTQSGRRERELEEIYSKLEEHMELERAIYDGIGNVGKRLQACAGALEESAAGGGEADEAAFKDAVDAINENTVHAAKLIAKYQVKNSESMKKALDEIMAKVESLGEGLNGDDGAELAQVREKMFDGNREILSYAEEIVKGNREMAVIGNEILERLDRVEETVRSMEGTKPEEIAEYIDKAVSGINTQIMKNSFAAQRQAQKPQQAPAPVRSADMRNAQPQTKRRVETAVERLSRKEKSASLDESQ